LFTVVGILVLLELGMVQSMSLNDTIDGALNRNENTKFTNLMYRVCVSGKNSKRELLPEAL